MNWRELPVLRDDKLLWVDTTGYPLPGAIVPCLLCTKPFLMRPFVGAPDQVCPECAKTYAECAVVRCSKCRHHPVVCRLKPGVTDSGYRIQKQAVLHTDACNMCTPGLTNSRIVEIDQWERLVRPSKAVIIVPGR